MKGKNTVFYKCPVCQNLIGLIQGDSNNIKCCGQEMKLLIAEQDKKEGIIVYKKKGKQIVVNVEREEYLQNEKNDVLWIAQVSDNQTTRIRLYSNQKPEVRFNYIPQSTIYAYCKKQGLLNREVD